MHTPPTQPLHSNAQIARIVGLRVTGVEKRLGEKKMKLQLTDSAPVSTPVDSSPR